MILDPIALVLPSIAGLLSLISRDGEDKATSFDDSRRHRHHFRWYEQLCCYVSCCDLGFFVNSNWFHSTSTLNLAGVFVTFFVDG